MPSISELVLEKSSSISSSSASSSSSLQGEVLGMQCGLGSLVNDHEMSVESLDGIDVGGGNGKSSAGQCHRR